MNVENITELTNDNGIPYYRGESELGIIYSFDRTFDDICYYDELLDHYLRDSDGYPKTLIDQ